MRRASLGQAAGHLHGRGHGPFHPQRSHLGPSVGSRAPLPRTGTVSGLKATFQGRLTCFQDRHTLPPVGVTDHLPTAKGTRLRGRPVACKQRFRSVSPACKTVAPSLRPTSPGVKGTRLRGRPVTSKGRAGRQARTPTQATRDVRTSLFPPIGRLAGQMHPCQGLSRPVQPSQRGSFPIPSVATRHRLPYVMTGGGDPGGAMNHPRRGGFWLHGYGTTGGGQSPAPDLRACILSAESSQV